MQGGIDFLWDEGVVDARQIHGGRGGDLELDAEERPVRFRVADDPPRLWIALLNGSVRVHRQGGSAQVEGWDSVQVRVLDAVGAEAIGLDIGLGGRVESAPAIAVPGPV